MRKIVKQFMFSRVVWFLAVAGWIWIAGERWYEALSAGFTPIMTTQVVIATALATLFSAAFVVKRGWRKGSGEPR